jgi:hypothetical protein
MFNTEHKDLIFNEIIRAKISYQAISTENASFSLVYQRRPLQTERKDAPDGRSGYELAARIAPRSL